MTNPSKSIIDVDDDLYQYILTHGVREPGICRRLRRRTAEHVLGGMQITPDQGQLLHFLIRLTGSVRAVEVGVFTGCSALRIAMALPPAGRLLACDTRPDFTEIGIPYWEEAGVREKIDLVHGPAAETLTARITAGEGESFDFAFIDADKENYPEYYELCLSLLKCGGLMCVDNVLWNGRVTDPSDSTVNTESIRRLNRRVRDDPRAECVILPIADGLTLIRKLSG